MSNNSNKIPQEFQAAFTAIQEKMQAAKCSDLSLRAFSNSFEKLANGDTGTITDLEIQPVSSLPRLGDLQEYADAGKRAACKVAILNLNGGLGTGMGLDKAKSLLPVKNKLSFLEILARQIIDLRQKLNFNIPFILMNSFNTDSDSLMLLESLKELVDGQDEIPFSFLQNKVPKLKQSNLHPAKYSEDPSAEWCPPGHGDIYSCLNDSGILDSLLAKGYEYAFISNSDNLGATFDERIVGYLSNNNISFLMEVANRTPADRKGGHLARNSSGNLILRERAQCPKESLKDFEDIKKFAYFNTNSLWINLNSLKDALNKHEGYLDLPLIINSKTINPADSGSEKVFQLETAMGAAISTFPDAVALEVPRTRFAPVKTTNDLLELWSDNFELTDNFTIQRTVERPPVDIQLDPSFYRNLSDFKKSFPSDVPNLLKCESLVVKGNVIFSENIILEGDVEIVNHSDQAKVLEGNKTYTGKISL
ncbi:MAG: UTP--glucose-1-phosphate uridylyltransferase [Bdellovibrionota bacterium]